MSASVRLVEPLSEGGMGAVWLADHLTLQMRVVVKVMAAELAETGFARFSDEALAAAQVRSPHVVQMLDRGVTRDGVPFIVMEHLQGETLFETVLLHGPRPLGEVVLVVDQLAKALERVHGMGIVHRDVKPDNVFVCDVGQAETFVKLFDFGIAKSLDGWMTHLTGAGVVMGTPCYLSPEAIDATHEIDARLDLWGLAAVAFYALTGHEAFVGEDPREVRASLHASCRPLPSRHVPSIPKGIDAWFERAFAVARDSRFSTATEMAEALTAAHAETLAAKGGAVVPSRADWVGELPASARAGAIVADKYVVERVIGVGGMAVVVCATHVQLDRPVAIKMMLPRLLHHRQLVERFELEARAAVRLRSEHVSRILDVGHLDDGAPYIVMEYLEGRTLGEEIERGPLSIHNAVQYVLQACEAVAEAHALGIVHRDLKPGNLFLTKEVHGAALVKVLDFGIAKAAAFDAVEGGKTHATAALGTPEYMAPEQHRSAHDVDARADIWSLGVVLYELLTGRLPFEARTGADVTAKVLRDRATPLSSRRADVPEGLALAIHRCLDKDPAARFATVTELADVLAQFAPAGDEASRRITAVQAGVCDDTRAADLLDDERDDDQVATRAMPVVTHPVAIGGEVQRSARPLVLVLACLAVTALSSMGWALVTQKAPRDLGAASGGLHSASAASSATSLVASVEEAPSHAISATVIPASDAPVPATKVTAHPKPKKVPPTKKLSDEEILGGRK